MAEQDINNDVKRDSDSSRGQHPPAMPATPDEIDSENFTSNVVVTNQPSSTQDETRPDDCEADLKDINFQDDEDKNGKSSPDKRRFSIEIPLDEGCISVSADCCSVSKEICGGFTILECVGPNVGCTLSCCGDGLEVVTKCSMGLCSANCLFGAIRFTLGLAFDTKVVWNGDGTEFEVLGTGVETTEGIAVGILGSKIGTVDREKRKKMVQKRKAKEARKKAKTDQDDEHENGQTSGEVNHAIGSD